MRMVFIGFIIVMVGLCLTAHLMATIEEVTIGDLPTAEEEEEAD